MNSAIGTMTETVLGLRAALEQHQFEDFLVQLAVVAGKRAYAKDGQGLLTGDAHWDALCSRAATQIEAVHPETRSLQTWDKDLTLYIATDLYWGKGGHTPLLMDLIKVDRSARRELILTHVTGLPTGDDFKQKLAQALGPQVPAHQLVADTLLQKILILRAYIKAKRPRRIVLMTHQYDVVTYCGLTGTSAQQIIKILHADTFTLGMNIPWYVPVSPNALGARRIANMMGRAVFVWPIAAEDQGARPWLEWQPGGPLTTCSHGTERKFEGRIGLSYGDVVALRMQMLPGRHVHIGDLSEEGLAAIQKQIVDAGQSLDRFVHVKAVPSLWQYLKHSDIQLCISSFPVAGPRGLVETKGCGLPVLVFEDQEYPIRSSQYYAYEGCLRWSTRAELIDAYKQLTPALLRQQAALSRADYENNHSMSALGEKAVIPDNYIAPNAVEGWEKP